MQASNKKDSILYQQNVITSKNISHRNIVGYALCISPNYSLKEYFSKIKQNCIRQLESHNHVVLSFIMYHKYLLKGKSAFDRPQM